MYVASWSGGKDACLSCYKAIQQGYDVASLVNFISATYQRVRFHGTPKDLLTTQAEAIGLPLVQRETADDNYEEIFKQTLRELVPEGLEGMVFGDIHLEDCLQWCRRVCAEVGIEAVHPIFGMTSEEVMAEFLAAGFKAVIVSGRPEYFSAEQMGMTLGPEFLQWCATQPGLDVCGENGEYHTVVVDGPIFGKRLELTEAEPANINGHWFLDIRKWALADKPSR